MSTLNVDKVDPSTGTALEIGSSGDTITVPSGATFAVSGTMNASSITAGTVATARLGSGTASSSTVLYGDQTYKTEPSGVALTGSTNNQVVTVTGADAISGETNFIYDGTIVGCGALGASAALGSGVHVKTSDTGGGVEANGDNLVLEENGNVGIQMLSATNGTGHIFFGNSGDTDEGFITYDADNNRMRFGVVSTEAMRIDSNGDVGIGTTNPTRKLYVTSSDDGAVVAYFEEGISSGYDSAIVRITGAQTTTDNSYVLLEGHNGNASGHFKFYDSGDCQNTNNSYGAISDERLKQDITDANSQWDDIKALKIKNFKLKSNTDLTLLGVVAQDLETDNMNGLVEETKPFKEDVAYHSDFGTIEAGTEDNGAEAIKDKDDNITGYEDLFTEGEKVKGVKYSVLYMKAIKALQESMERIEQLEDKVTALENA
jgi:hypothetical protein